MNERAGHRFPGIEDHLRRWPDCRARVGGQLVPVLDGPILELESAFSDVEEPDDVVVSVA